jgi:D-alanyl-D-alanine carboxypeptidase
VTGQKLSAYINRRILKPERMRRSVFPTGAAFPSPHAQGYTSQTLSGRIANTTKWDPSSEWAAGALISTLGDLRRWARDVATGNLLSRATQRQRERFIPIAGMPSASYGLGLFNVNGWIGHNGSLPGYESLSVYLPSRSATMVVLLNSDMSPPQAELSTLVGEAISKVITPRHVYELSAAVQVPHPE